MARIVKNIIKRKKSEKAKQDPNRTVYNSSMSYMFYGQSGKTATASALSLHTKSPILILSPSGSAKNMEEEFDNIVAEEIPDLNYLRSIIKDLNTEIAIYKNLTDIIAKKDSKRLEKAREHYESQGENFDELIEDVKNGIMPIGGLVVEECSLVSSWIRDEVNAELGVDRIGEDKSMMGADWELLKNRLMEFYTDVLRTPGITILSTGDRKPDEKQNLNKIVPNLCVGSAQRLLIDMIGNIFYFNSDNSEYTVRIADDKKIQAKNKILKIYSNQKLESELNLTNKPEYLWEYINNARKQDKEEVSKKTAKEKKPETKNEVKK